MAYILYKNGDFLTVCHRGCLYVWVQRNEQVPWSLDPTTPGEGKQQTWLELEVAWDHKSSHLIEWGSEPVQNDLILPPKWPMDLGFGPLTILLTVLIHLTIRCFSFHIKHVIIPFFITSSGYDHRRSGVKMHDYKFASISFSNALKITVISKRIKPEQF